MKKILLFALAAIFAANFAAANEPRKTRKELRAEQEAIDRAYFEAAEAALEARQFVLEANQVIFKYGSSAYVTPTTNFVAVDGDRAVVQVAFDVPASGFNGLGGITVTGNVSGYKQTVDKKGNIRVTMNVMGTGISAQVSISLPNGSPDATVTVNPNLHSNRISLRGVLLPLEKAHVFQGSSL